MRKIIIVLIITLVTFMGGNIYTNNEQRLSENITKIYDDNTIISEENTIISELLLDLLLNYLIYLKKINM